MTSLSESKLLGTGNLGATSLTRSAYSVEPVHPGYDPIMVEYEPDTKPASYSRRRPRVLATSRRPAGNYYERLLRKRSKRQGRFGPYYDVESIEGSDLSVLSDVDSMDAYHGASLLLSVEGAGLSPEGKRVDFTYTPPPIPLYGSSPRLDDKLLALKPTTTLKPVDNFLAGYMERMAALKSALNDRLDRDRSRRLEYGLKPLETGPRPSSYTPIPSYTQSHDYVPVRHLASDKLERVPVTSYRRKYDDGRTHRVDVFSLGEIQPRLPTSASRAIELPTSATGGQKLSVLDKINIKAAIIASKMEPDPMKRRRPRSEYAAKKYRELRNESKESIYSGLPSSGGLHSSVPPAPRPSERKAIRTEDGYSKPKNLLSWQYRLDAQVRPQDVLYAPSSFGRIRHQVREAQERLDRHRQLIDRYLPEEGSEGKDIRAQIQRKMDAERREPVAPASTTRVDEE